MQWPKLTRMHHVRDTDAVRQKLCWIVDVLKMYTKSYWMNTEQILVCFGAHSRPHRHTLFPRKPISMYVRSMHRILFLDSNLRVCLLLNVEHWSDKQKNTDFCEINYSINARTDGCNRSSSSGGGKNRNNENCLTIWCIMLSSCQWHCAPFFAQNSIVYLLFSDLNACTYFLCPFTLQTLNRNVEERKRF